MPPQILLHVGYIKAGSSWLQEWLTRRPDVALAVGGLGGYRTIYDLINAADREPEPPAYFAISEERLTGGLDVPDGYFRLLLRDRGGVQAPPPIRANQAKVARWLHTLYPQARVLIVTRGFAGALRSVYSQVVRLGGDVRFDQFLDRYRAYILEWLDYDHVLALYSELFGSARVLCLPFELLRQDEALFALTLERELGLGHHETRLGRIYPSLTAEEMYWYAAVARRMIVPLTKRVRERLAILIYKLYASRVVDRAWSRLLIRAASRLSRRKADLQIPPGYLQQFAAHASRLTALPGYAPYRAEYLVASEPPNE